jgi:anti-sigma factor RsiW
MKVVVIRDSRRTRHHLGAFLSDDLPADARQKVLKHALLCRACLRELQMLERMRHRMQRAVQGQAVPPELHRRIGERIRSEAGGTTQSRTWSCRA